MPISNIVMLTGGVALGLCLGLLLMKLRAGRELAELKSACARHEAEAQLLARQAEELKSTEALLRMELNEISLSNTRLETLLEEAKKQTDQQQAQFEALSQKTLKALKDELEAKAAKEAKLHQELMNERVANVIKPLKELIEENEKKVREVEKQHTEDTASLKKHIELIVEETGKLVSVKNKLAEALSNSKGRGDWGEMELIRLLEASGLMPGVHYEAQRVQDGGSGQDGGLRPDITIRLSNQRILYVDAKTIMVNLERLLSAGESEEAAEERKKHAAALEKEVMSLSLKAYESRCRDSIDFVVLYVPRESMLRAALEEKPALMEQAFQRRVILASPLILMSILKTVAYGWDQAQLSQKANEIHALGKDLHKRAATFLERFLKIGDKLEALGTQFEDARISLTGRQGMLPQLRKFEEYGCKSDKLLPVGVAGPDEDTEEVLILEAVPPPGKPRPLKLKKPGAFEEAAALDSMTESLP